MWKFILYAMDSGVPRRSFAVAIIVGTILNLINQGDAAVRGISLNCRAIAFQNMVSSRAR
jgi:hypothetical protein